MSKNPPTSGSASNFAAQIQARFQQAMTLQQNGRLQEAEVIYRQILKLQPKHFDALHLLGVVAYQTGNFQSAIDLVGQAIGIYPNAAAFYSNRGNALLELKQQKAAIADYDKAILLKPDYAQAYNNRGSALLELKQLEAALASYDMAIALAPDYAQAYNHRGGALQELRRPDAAIASFDKAISLKPNYAEAYSNRGIALLELKRLDTAVASFDKAITFRPDYAEAHCNRGIALLALGQPDDAVASFDKAISLKPDLAEAYCNRGTALQELKQLDAAVASFGKAISLKPDFADARTRKLFLQATICDWETIGDDAEIIPTLGVSTGAVQPFAMLALEDNPARHRARSETFARERYAPPQPAPAAVSSTRPARLRIGYFSADFHGHAVMYQLIRILELHDRTRFEIYAYSFGPPAQDAMRTRAKEAVDVFRDVRALGGQDIAALARKDRIDIAIDLMGYTRNGRPEIFVHRAAPVQISYLGYPGTLGASFMDYLISDRILIPQELRRHYSEKIIYLPRGHMATDNTKQIAEQPINRAQMSLPERAFVFCCFNSSYKISPAEFDIWMRLLMRVGNSVLWLVRANSRMQQNLRREALKREVDPERIIFAERIPMADHLARHRLADLFLDTFHYTGHSTAADALWAGLPLVTKLGQGFAARVGASLLDAAGLSGLVANSTEDYERLALELAENPQKLAALRESLEQSRTRAPLFDSESFARHIEEAYRQAYEHYLAGRGPQIIEVAEGF
jgi:protein O-GlcNAc transferase